MFKQINFTWRLKSPVREYTLKGKKKVKFKVARAII